MDSNQIRAKETIKKFGYKFNEKDRPEILKLLNEEYQNYHPGSSEYLRVLCGLLFCIGNKEDADIIEKVKYGLNMDVGFMVDLDWINDLRGLPTDLTRNEMIDEFKEYYQPFLDS